MNSLVNSDMQIWYHGVPRIIIFSLLLFLFAFGLWDKLKLLIVAYMFSGLTLIIFSHWLITFETHNYAWFFYNSNTLGIVMYSILFIHLIAFAQNKDIKNRFLFALVIVLNLSLLFVSTSRSVWIAIIVAFFIFLMFNVITRNKIIYRISFMIILFVIMLITYIYPKLHMTDIGRKVNEYSYSITGSPFFTGRQDLWSRLFLVIEKKPYFGYGFSSSPSDFFQTTASSHNTYIEVLLKGGIVGLVFISLILFVVWELLYFNTQVNKINSQAPKLFLCFYSGLLIKQTFDTTFMTGQFSVNVLQWMLIGIGIGAVASIRSGLSKASK